MGTDDRKNDKARVLFVCIHNSARSQIAEAFLNHLAGDRFEAESAGIEPSELNPLAVDVMREVGIDISNNRSKKVFDLYKQGRLYNYVVPVCDDAAEKCPIFPGFARVIQWSFQNPETFTGSYQERLIKMRGLREEIKNKIEQFIENKI
ncbi:MAG: arsenate reductase ArsC [Deltaproteobacteria bacterium]|nr:arsenate reductase ArsC [Deltaproteobacteria bacterium]